MSVYIQKQKQRTKTANINTMMSDRKQKQRCLFGISGYNLGSVLLKVQVSHISESESEYVPLPSYINPHKNDVDKKCMEITTKKTHTDDILLHINNNPYNGFKKYNEEG